ncbi:hypothetical protein ACOSQ3_016917 [Xanthoceras sorbifolium]
MGKLSKLLWDRRTPAYITDIFKFDIRVPRSHSTQPLVCLSSVAPSLLTPLATTARRSPHHRSPNVAALHAVGPPNAAKAGGAANN